MYLHTHSFVKMDGITVASLAWLT